MANIKKYFTTSEGALYILIALVWANPIVKLFNAVFLRLPVINAIGGYADKIVTAIFAIIAFGAIKRRLKTSDLAFYFGLLFLYILQYFYPNTGDLLDENFSNVFFWVIPMYFVGCCTDIKKIDKLLFIASIACVVFYAYHDLIFERQNEGDMEGYSQHSSYQLLPYTLYTLWYVLRKFSWYYVAIPILGIFLHLSFGARGPLVCVFSFIALFITFFNQGKYKWPVVSITVLLGIIVYNNIEAIVLSLSFLIEKMGMSTRIIYFFVNEEFTQVDSRDVIIDTLMSKLREGGMLGYGLFGSWQFVGVYAHRIYVDFWFSFGYIVGSLFMLIFCAIYYKSLRMCNNPEEKGFWLLLFVISIIHLMFSQFFLTNVHFWMFLGYCVSRIRNIQLKEI